MDRKARGMSRVQTMWRTWMGDTLLLVGRGGRGRGVSRKVVSGE